MTTDEHGYRKQWLRVYLWASVFIGGGAKFPPP